MTKTTCDQIIIALAIAILIVALHWAGALQ